MKNFIETYAYFQKFKKANLLYYLTYSLKKKKYVVYSVVTYNKLKLVELLEIVLTNI